MKKTESLSRMLPEASDELQQAFLKGLKSINEFFDAPSKLQVDFAQRMKVANNVLNTYARIRQSESGHEQFILGMIKFASENKKEFKDLIIANLPQGAMFKKLKS